MKPATDAGTALPSPVTAANVVSTSKFREWVVSAEVVKNCPNPETKLAESAHKPRADTLVVALKALVIMLPPSILEKFIEEVSISLQFIFAICALPATVSVLAIVTKLADKPEVRILPMDKLLAFIEEVSISSAFKFVKVALAVNVTGLFTDCAEESLRCKKESIKSARLSPSSVSPFSKTPLRLTLLVIAI
jgi:hypothetical protein